MRRIVLPGDMFIVYGKSRDTDGASIDLGQAEYVRHIKQGLFSTKILDYGRPESR